jgi:diguanylate cyclase (GGDEF)-like protein/PAS domain S-box-containing protein
MTFSLRGFCSIYHLLLAIALVVLSVVLNRLELLERWDNLAYDLSLRQIDRVIDDDIVIIAIDDISLQKLGHWPWPRSIHAQLLHTLTDVGVAAVGMDILFMEPDNRYPQNDRRLLEAIRRNGKVILPVVVSETEGVIELSRPLEEFAQAAAQLAHVTVPFDVQGEVRHLTLFVTLPNGERIPALSLALSQSIGVSSMPSSNNPLLIFSGSPHSFRQVSYIDVLSDQAIRNSLKDKAVIIGMTAAGLGRRIPTPVSEENHLMSGAEFHANALAAIKTGKFISTVRLPWVVFYMLCLVGIPVLLCPRLTPTKAVLALVISLGLMIGISFGLLKYGNVWLSPVSAIAGLILSYPLWGKQRLEQLARLLFTEQNRAETTLAAIHDVVISTDDENRIIFMNPAAEKMFAISFASAKGLLIADLCQYEKGCLVNSEKETKLLPQVAQMAETQTIRNRNGDEFTVRIVSKTLHTETGQLTGYVHVLNDLTEIVKIHHEIAFVGAHDALTGLPNRVLLEERLKQAINSAGRKHVIFALLFIDLDGFKRINDGAGHSSGDELLKDVARRLRSWVRISDTIARWGGDEFIILLEDLTLPVEAADVATKIIEGFATPFILNDHELFVTPSIGISLYPKNGRQTDMLLAKADAAMYSVKKNGCNNFCFYSQDLDSLAKERLILEKELHQALQAEQFEMHYQPQIDLVTGRLIGAEALIRWRHPEKGVIAPDLFIGLAEDMGLIVPLGEWIVRTVCAQINRWEQKGCPVIRIAINLSPRQFVHKDLVTSINREILQYGVSPEKIQVEITESMMIKNPEQVIKVLNRLKSAGISIAVDDFGTGFSSLENLKRFPIDKLKIDKSFVDSVMQNPDDASIVQAVIALGHNMNMQIIAEGVETLDQLDFLRARSCDFGQGYYFSRPLCAQDLTKLLLNIDEQFILQSESAFQSLRESKQLL